MTVRTRITASHRCLLKQLTSLRKLDQENQKRINPSTGGLTKGKLSKQQFHMLTENVFFSAFRSYENFIEEVFILYCLGKKTPSGKHAKPFIAPNNYTHAMELMKSSMPFLDWAKPGSIIKRSELYLNLL